MARQIDALFDELLAQKGERSAPRRRLPAARCASRGELVAAARRAASTRAEMEALLFEIVDPEQKRQIIEELDLDFAYALRRQGALSRQLLLQDDRPRRGLPHHPHQGPDARRSRLPRGDRASSPSGAPGWCWSPGPTGSGKSTTLAAMINHINRDARVPHPHHRGPGRVRARAAEVRRSRTARSARTRSSFAQRHPQRRAARTRNVILIGELRNNETMKLALQLASFGVLVFATVHTNSAPATIERIINAFPADEQPQMRGMLAESLAGIVAQQLLKTADGKGRVAAHEILIGSTARRLDDPRGQDLSDRRASCRSGQAHGMQTHGHGARALALARKITAEAALEKASDKETLRRRLAEKFPQLAEAPV